MILPDIIKKRNKVPTNKVILITGATKGFGFEMAKAALENGDQVIATTRQNPTELQQALGNHPGLLTTVVDITDEQQVESAVARALAQFGKIDVLINNAGFGLLAAVEEASPAEVRKQFDTNVFGTLNVTRAVLPHMRTRKQGHIINITSLFAFDSVPGWTIYGSTKFALEGISKGLAKEVRPLGIHVTALAPGLFRTDFLNESSFQKGGKTIADYEETVGPVRNNVSLRHGKQKGDPAKLARVAIRIAHEEQPPLHLLVGSDAIRMFLDDTSRTKEDVDRWMELSLSTDHD